MTRPPRTRRSAWLACLAAAGCGSAAPSGNPSFPPSRQAARAVLAAAAAHPTPLTRPLVVVGGFLDPLGATLLAGDFRDYLHDDGVVAVSLATADDFDDCRHRIIAAVDAAHPSPDPAATVDVDVVGISMGGLAARYAAVDLPGRRRLRVHRLFTISSPHRGAWRASVAPFDVSPLQRDMRVGSPFVRRVNAARPPPDGPFPVYAYVCLNDDVIGPPNAAPPGQTPWWLPPMPLVPAHASAFLDDRIRADIVRRLRGEPPLTMDPPTPLPLRKHPF